MAQAVAVVGDRMIAVGSNTDVDAWHGPHTRGIDAGGKLLLPGFNDAHVHFVSGGMQLENVQLKVEEALAVPAGAPIIIIPFFLAGVAKADASPDR